MSPYNASELFDLILVKPKASKKEEMKKMAFCSIKLSICYPCQRFILMFMC